MGAILQENDQIDEAISVTTRALDIYEYHFGHKHPGVATAHHSIAHFFHLKGDHRSAQLAEKKSADILAEFFGEQDSRTKEARLAVQSHASNLDSQQENTRALLQQKLPKVQNAPARATDDNIGTLPIRDILKYINNSEQRNPRTRGGASRFGKNKI
jgi:hypothetical protein